MCASGARGAPAGGGCVGLEPADSQKHVLKIVVKLVLSGKKHVMLGSVLLYCTAQYFCCTLFMYSVLLLYFMHVLSTLCMYTVLHA